VLNFSNTSLSGTYSSSARVTNGAYSGTASTVFGIDDLIVNSMTGGPYIAGDNLTISGNVSYTVRDVPYEGNVSIDLSYPNGTHKYLNSSVFQATQSYTQSGDKQSIRL